jgi:hypothetical protein
MGHGHHLPFLFKLNNAYIFFTTIYFAGKVCIINIFTYNMAKEVGPDLINIDLLQSYTAEIKQDITETPPDSKAIQEMSNDISTNNALRTKLKNGCCKPCMKAFSKSGKVRVSSELPMPSPTPTKTVHATAEWMQVL